MLEGALVGAQRRSREWQREQFRRTGYATAQPEIGHSVVMALRENGFHPTVAQVGGQLAAVGTAYNFQGNVRIAQLIGRSKRTVQRARALLEESRLIRSELLLTGDMIDGQRAPVRHPQVVRDVSALQRLARLHESQRRNPAPRKRRRKGPSAAEVPVETTPPTAEFFAQKARDNPEFAAFFSTMAEAASKRERRYDPPKPPPNAPATIDPRQVDMWDDETAQRERERGPPAERGPPPQR